MEEKIKDMSVENITVISRGDEMWYNSHYLRHKSTPTDKLGKKMVITAGFIPLKVRIENMIAAGLELQTKREEMYPDMYEYESGLLDEDYEDDPDEITIMSSGMRAEDALSRRRMKPQKKEVKNGISEEGQELPQKIREPSQKKKLHVAPRSEGEEV